MAQWFRSLAAQAWEAEIESQCHVKVCLEFSRYQHSQKFQGETLLQREKAERKREGGGKERGGHLVYLSCICVHKPAWTLVHTLHIHLTNIHTHALICMQT